MSDPIEPVPNETIADVLRLAADGELLGFAAVAIAPRLAAHLAALKVAVGAVKGAWDNDEIGGDPLANLFAIAGDGPTDLVIFQREKLIDAALVALGVPDDGRTVAERLRAAARKQDTGLALVSAAELARLRDVEFEAKAADRARRRESGHG